MLIRLATIHATVLQALMAQCVRSVSIFISPYWSDHYGNKAEIQTRGERETSLYMQQSKVHLSFHIQSRSWASEPLMPIHRIPFVQSLAHVLRVKMD